MWGPKQSIVQSRELYGKYTAPSRLGKGKEPYSIYNELTNKSKPGLGRVARFGVSPGLGASEDRQGPEGDHPSEEGPCRPIFRRIYLPSTEKASNTLPGIPLPE